MGCHTSFYNVAATPEDENWVATLIEHLEQEALVSEAMSTYPVLVKYYQRLARHVRNSSSIKWKLFLYYQELTNKSVHRYKGEVYTSVPFEFIFRTYIYDLTITNLDQFKELGLHLPDNSWSLVDNWEELLTKFWEQYPEGIITTG